MTILVMMVVMTLIAANLNWGKERWKEIVKTDGKGYYAYLPAVFICKDLNFGFFDQIEKEKYYDKFTFYDYRSSANGKLISKYYCGTAVAEMPFFLVAHGLSSVVGNDTDGYSKWYMIFVNISVLFYLLIGLLFLNSTLKLFEISDLHRAIVLLTCVFGTNLFFYIVGESSTSHAFSFGFISMFVYYSKQYFRSFRGRDFLISSLLLGMIVLIRPVNGLIIFILPFLAGDFESLKIGFKSVFKQYKYLIFGGVGFLAIVSIQLIIYKISTGDFFVYAYAEEGFIFSEPHFFDILFSYRKGLFLYTPIYLISFVGLFYLWKKSRFQVISWLGFFMLITYVFSSWWMWYYGGSFSSRVYVEFLPVFMLILGLALKGIKRKLVRIPFLSTILALILICQIQIFQYRYYKIHWSEMTKEMYWDSFLRVDQILK